MSASWKLLRACAIAAPLAASAPAAAADLAQGRQIYVAQCAICHGGDGRPTLAGAPDLRRSLALARSDRQLVAMLRSGRGAMPGFLGIINDREMLDVVAYLRTLG